MAEGDGPPNGMKPKGRPKGSKNRLPLELKMHIENALELAGKRAKRGDGTLKNAEPATVYLLKLAENNPAIFAQLLKQILPQKVDVDVSLFGGDMLELLTERRQQLSQMKTIEHNEEEDV